MAERSPESPELATLMAHARALVGVELGELADALGLPEVNAFAKPANAGSRRVLAKAGFKVLRFVPALGRLHYRRRHGGPPGRGGRARHGT